MKIKAQLIQPGICKTPFSECEVEVNDSDSDETMLLKAAHKLLQNFDIEIKRVK